MSGGQGQANGKRRPFSQGTLHTDFPPMCFDDVAACRQSKSCAALAAFVGTILGREKGIEDLRQLFWRNSRTGVADGHVHRFGAGCGPDPDQDPAAFGHRLSRIDQQVEQDLLDLVSVRPAEWRVIVFLFDGDSVFAQFALEQYQGILGQRGQIGGLHALRAIARDRQNRA